MSYAKSGEKLTTKNPDVAKFIIGRRRPRIIR
jgi:hypothetical protein